MKTLAQSSVRRCHRCVGTLEPTNQASLCFRCALRAYLDIRPGIGWFDDCAASPEQWRAAIGFSADEPMIARVEARGEQSEYLIERYGVKSAEYHAGQTLSSFGDIWLARVRCPSGMIYETALPAGRVSDERAILITKKRRAEPLPERVVDSAGIATSTVGKQLACARRYTVAMTEDRGRQRDDSGLEGIIRGMLKRGDTPTIRSVAESAYEGPQPDKYLRARWRRHGKPQEILDEIVSRVKAGM